jgi:hypothetical protein
MLRRELLIPPIAVLTVPIAAQVQAGWKVRIQVVIPLIRLIRESGSVETAS